MIVLCKVRLLLGAAVLFFYAIAAIVFIGQSDPLEPLVELNLSMALYVLGFVWAGLSAPALWNMARSAGQNGWSFFAIATYITFVYLAWNDPAASASLDTLSTEAYIWIGAVVFALMYDLVFQIIWYLKFRGMK